MFVYKVQPMCTELLLYGMVSIWATQNEPICNPCAVLLLGVNTFLIQHVMGHATILFWIPIKFLTK